MSDPKSKKGRRLTSTRKKDVSEFIKADYKRGPQFMSLITAKTRDGYKVRVRTITLGLTYQMSGLIVGIPDERLNHATLHAIAKHTNDSFNDRVPVLNRKPEITPFEIKPGQIVPMLPRHYCVLELESDATDQKHIFSWLVVILYRMELEFKDLAKIIKEDLSQLDYAKYAQSFDP